MKIKQSITSSQGTVLHLHGGNCFANIKNKTRGEILGNLAPFSLNIKYHFIFPVSFHINVEFLFFSTNFNLYFKLALIALNTFPG